MSIGKLAIIHTTPVTVEPLKALAREIVGNIEIINTMDDSILPQIAANGGDLSAVEERWIQYARFAEQAGADCILSACSSVGEVAERARGHVSIPVVRIDEAMAEQAVRLGTRIGVAATLRTTLEPTMRLLRSKAAEAGKTVELLPVLAESAYGLLLKGDREGHDRELAGKLGEIAGETEIVVLAQASMARVADRLAEPLKAKFLSSPASGMEAVKNLMMPGGGG